MTAPSANGQPEPFDLDAARAAAADEADDRSFAFSFGGGTYVVPSPRRWPLSAQRDLENGLLDETMPKLIGTDGYEQLVAAGATFRDLELLFDAIAKRANFPNSRRSGPPARRAGTRRSSR